MKKLAGFFIAMFMFVGTANAADAMIVPGKHYVDTAVASRAPAIALATIVDTLNANNTVVKANGAIQSTDKGAANGVATLGADGKVPAAQLPDFGGGNVQADWNAVSGDAQILNRPNIGTTAGTIAAGNDTRFDTIPVGQPAVAAGAGRALIWIEP